MQSLFLLGVVLVIGMVVATTWLVGLWNNILTWVCLLLAALIASSFFEVTANQMQIWNAESQYIADFAALWGLFIGSFLALRIATDLFSKYRMKFDIWTESVGRSVMALLIGLTFMSFTLFSLHTSPLPPDGPWGSNFMAHPNDSAFGITLDRGWASLVRTLSNGSFAESASSQLWPPYPGEAIRRFDPDQSFFSRYYQRRLEIRALDTEPPAENAP